MATRQELVNWMTEKKENLTFESKVQLIYDFWTLRKYLEKKEPEYKKQIQNLETERDKYKADWERDKLNQKELNFLKNMPNWFGNFQYKPNLPIPDKDLQIIKHNLANSQSRNLADYPHLANAVRLEAFTWDFLIYLAENYQALINKLNDLETKTQVLLNKELTEE